MKNSTNVRRSADHSPVTAQTYNLKNNGFIRNKQLFGKTTSDFGFANADLQFPKDDETTIQVAKNNMKISQQVFKRKLENAQLKFRSIIEPDLASFGKVRSATDSNPHALLAASQSKKASPNMPLLNVTDKLLSPERTQTDRYHGRSLSSTTSKPCNTERALTNKSLTKPRSDLDRYASEGSDLKKKILAMQRFDQDRRSRHESPSGVRDISYISETRKGILGLDTIKNSFRSTAFSGFFPATQGSSDKIKGNEIISSATTDNILQTEPIDSAKYKSGKLHSDYEPMAITEDVIGKSSNTRPSRTNTESLSTDKQALLAGIQTSWSKSSHKFADMFFSESPQVKSNRALNIPSITATDFKSTLSSRYLTTVKGCTPIKQNSAVTACFLPKISLDHAVSAQKLKASYPYNPLSTWEDVLDAADMQLLSKELPGAAAGALPNRNDVIHISKWVEANITNIDADRNLNEKEKCIACDKTYNIALNELIRQISIDCSERGDLLAQIWMSYLRIFQNFRSQLACEQERIKEEFESSYSRIHKTYQDIIQEKDSRLAQVESEFKTVTSSFQEIRGKYSTKLEYETNILQENSEIKRLMAHLQTQLRGLQIDNENLQARLEQRRMFSARGPNVKKINNSRSTQYHSKHVKNKARRAKANADLEGEESDAITEESSENFDLRHDNENDDDDDDCSLSESRFIHKVEHLNNAYIGNANQDASRDYMEQGIDTRDPEFLAMYKSDANCQTDIVLVESKFDAVFCAQHYVDELVTEHQLKQDVDVVATSEEFKKVEKQLRASEEAKQREEMENHPKYKYQRNRINPGSPMLDLDDDNQEERNLHKGKKLHHKPLLGVFSFGRQDPLPEPDNPAPDLPTKAKPDNKPAKKPLKRGRSVSRISVGSGKSTPKQITSPPAEKEVSKVKSPKSQSSQKKVTIKKETGQETISLSQEKLRSEVSPKYSSAMQSPTFSDSQPNEHNSVISIQEEAEGNRENKQEAKSVDEDRLSVRESMQGTPTLSRANSKAFQHLVFDLLDFRRKNACILQIST